MDEECVPETPINREQGSTRQIVSCSTKECDCSNVEERGKRKMHEDAIVNAEIPQLGLDIVMVNQASPLLLELPLIRQEHSPCGDPKIV